MERQRGKRFFDFTDQESEDSSSSFTELTSHRGTRKVIICRDKERSLQNETPETYSISERFDTKFSVLGEVLGPVRGGRNRKRFMTFILRNPDNYKDTKVIKIIYPVGFFKTSHSVDLERGVVSMTFRRKNI
jgi:hypothetical protein